MSDILELARRALKEHFDKREMALAQAVIDQAAEVARLTAERDAYYHAILRIEGEATKRQDNPLAALLLIRDIANRVLPPEGEA